MFVCLSSSNMPANASMAKRKRYSRIDQKPIPCCMAGIVNNGINPKLAEDNSPYKKPLTLFTPLIYFFLGVRLAQPSSLKSGSESLNSLLLWKNCFQSSFLPRALVYPRSSRLGLSFFFLSVAAYSALSLRLPAGSLRRSSL